MADNTRTDPASPQPQPPAAYAAYSSASDSDSDSSAGDGRRTRRPRKRVRFTHPVGLPADVSTAVTSGNVLQQAEMDQATVDADVELFEREIARVVADSPSDVESQGTTGEPLSKSPPKSTPVASANDEDADARAIAWREAAHEQEDATQVALRARVAELRARARGTRTRGSGKVPSTAGKDGGAGDIGWKDTSRS